MTGSKGILDDLEFENQMNKLGNDQLALTKFNARQVFAMSKILIADDKRITSLERRDRKFFGAVGGIGGAIGAGIVAAIELFTRK